MVRRTRHKPGTGASPIKPMPLLLQPPKMSLHLSTGSDAVQRLKAQLDGVPDVRQQQVESLRQAVADGSFKVSPEHIAEAMLAGAALRK